MRPRAWTLRVSLFGLPAHVVLNDLPSGLLPIASVCDLLYLVHRDRGWALAGFRVLQLGNLGALLAAPLGALDFLRLPADPEVRRLGTRHAIMNAILLPVFALCQVQRCRRPDHPSLPAIALLLAANAGLSLSAWHGARMVHAYRVRTGEQGSAVPVRVRRVPATW
jgi:uncharacterized membrane protein